MMHGQFGPAREMLVAAGEWETALALAVCQGDFASLRELAFPGASAAPAPPTSGFTGGVTGGVTGGLSLLDDDDGFGLGALSAGLMTGASAVTSGVTGSGGGAKRAGDVWATALAGLSEAERGDLSRLARSLVAAHERNAGRMFGAVNAGTDWRVGCRVLCMLHGMLRALKTDRNQHIHSWRRRTNRPSVPPTNSCAPRWPTPASSATPGTGALGARVSRLVNACLHCLHHLTTTHLPTPPTLSQSPPPTNRPPGKLPAMETSGFNAPSQFVQEGEVGPIPRAEAATLGVYLGMSDLADASEPARDPETTASDDQLDQLFALGVGEGGKGLGRSASAASSLDGGAGFAPGSAVSVWD
jgi:hypothetical protein